MHEVCYRCELVGWGASQKVTTVVVVIFVCEELLFPGLVYCDLESVL